MTLAVFQLKENSTHLLAFLEDSLLQMLSMVPPCRSSTAGSAGSHGSTCFNDLHSTGTSHWCIPACSWLGGNADSRLFLPLVKFFLGWQLLPLPFAEHMLLTLWAWDALPDLPFLTGFHPGQQQPGPGSPETLVASVYLPAAYDPFSSVNHRSAMTSHRNYFNIFLKRFKIVFTNTVLECVINLSWTVGKGWVEGWYVA